MGNLLVYKETKDDLDKNYIWTHFTTTWIIDDIDDSISLFHTHTHTRTHKVKQLLILVILLRDTFFQLADFFIVSQCSFSFQALFNGVSITQCLFLHYNRLIL